MADDNMHGNLDPALYGYPHGGSPPASSEGNCGQPPQGMNPYDVPALGTNTPGVKAVVVSDVLPLKKADQPQPASAPTLRTLE